MHVNEPQFFVEVLDERGEPVEPGERGEMVITPLTREAQPYLRFELKDEVELAAPSVCDCGRTFRFVDGGILGRSDDLTKVNGVLFSPTAVEDVVRQFDGVSDEFRVRIEDHPDKGVDVVELTAEVAPDARRGEGSIADELRKELKQATSLTFRIDLVEYETLERFTLKADRFTDERDTHA